MVNLIIDDKNLEVPEGTTVLRAAEQAGIHIPTLCDHPHLTAYGGCRLCMVEVQGFRVPMASCTMPVSQGMIVQTDTPKLRNSRKFVLSLIFSERNHFCPFCQVSGGDCELQNSAYEQEMTHWPISPSWNTFAVDASNPYFVLDNNRCILCRRCVRACSEMAGNFTLGVSERGAHSLVVADYGIPLGESTCISCGSCVQVCPTGALIDRKSAYEGHDTQVTHTASTCVGCSVGCAIDIVTRDNQIIRIDGAWDGEVNRGVLCKQGRFYLFADDRKRLTTPLVRKNGKLEPVSWDEALEVTAQNLKSLQGKASRGIAALASTRLPIEDLALFKEVFAECLQSDMVTSIEEGRPSATPAAVAEELGKPFEGQLSALEQADCVLVIGADLVQSHEVAGFMIKRQLPKGLKLVVIDPHENGLDAYANASLKATRGSDLNILTGLQAAVQKLGLEKTKVAGVDEGSVLAFITKNTGIKSDDFLKAAFLIASAEKPVIIYGKGIVANQTATTLKTLIEFAKMVGVIDDQHSDLISIKGEANSLAAAQFRLDRTFKMNGHQAAYIAVGDDHPHKRLLEHLQNTPFLVVEATYESALTQMAQVVFPVAKWCEQDGHYLNFEGRIQAANKAVESPENVKTNREVLQSLAEKLEFQPQMDWKTDLSQRVSAVKIS